MFNQEFSQNNQSDAISFKITTLPLRAIYDLEQAPLRQI